MGKYKRWLYLDYDGLAVLCKCGNRAPLITSWTEENPGRRFYCCVLEEKEGGCPFWVWHDAELRNPYYVGLLLELHEENKKLKAWNQFKKSSGGSGSGSGSGSGRTIQHVDIGISRGPIYENDRSSLASNHLPPKCEGKWNWKYVIVELVVVYVLFVMFNSRGKSAIPYCLP